MYVSIAYFEVLLLQRVQGKSIGERSQFMFVAETLRYCMLKKHDNVDEMIICKMKFGSLYKFFNIVLVYSLYMEIKPSFTSSP